MNRRERQTVAAIRGAALVAVVGGVLLSLVMLGCSGIQIPATNPTAPATSARGHIATIAESATGIFAAPTTPPVHAAAERILVEAKAADIDTSEAEKALRAFYDEIQAGKARESKLNADHAADRAAVVKHYEDKLTDERAAALKEHQANEWIGWRTRTYLWLAGGVVAAGVLLQILAPSLSLFGPIGSLLGGLVSLAGHAATGFVSIFFGWVDALIARVRASVDRHLADKKVRTVPATAGGTTS